MAKKDFWTAGWTGGIGGDIHSVNCSYTYLPTLVNIGQTFLAQLHSNTLCKLCTCKIVQYCIVQGFVQHIIGHNCTATYIVQKKHLMTLMYCGQCKFIKATYSNSMNIQTKNTIYVRVRIAICKFFFIFSQLKK